MRYSLAVGLDHVVDQVIFAATWTIMIASFHAPQFATRSGPIGTAINIFGVPVLCVAFVRGSEKDCRRKSSFRSSRQQRTSTVGRHSQCATPHGHVGFSGINIAPSHAASTCNPRRWSPSAGRRMARRTARPLGLGRSMAIGETPCKFVATPSV